MVGAGSIDALTVAAVTLGLALVVLLAGYLPALRAASVNPGDTLRSEL